MSTLVETIKVLVIDDDIEITKMLQIMLRTKEVVCKNDIVNIKNIIDNLDPHVIVLDYMLGDNNAFDVLKLISNPKRNIPIIYTALKLQCQIQTQLYLLGVMNVIMKPIGLSTIESVIENYYDISVKYRS